MLHCIVCASPNLIKFNSYKHHCYACNDCNTVQTVDDVAHVYLHGNLISKIGEGFIELFDGGYQSKTTKSRLNAILEANGLPSEYVFQRNYQWFVNYNGSPIPFFSGMRMN